MKTLEKHNEEILSKYKNGIICPKCGKELCDGEGIIDASYTEPARKFIHCLNCDFKGTCYA